MPRPSSFLERVHAAELGLPSNLLSLARLPLAIAFPFVAHSKIGALVVLFLAAASDIADGPVARRRHEVTATGTIVDPICDKLFGISVLATLVLTNQMPLWAIPALCAREIFETPLALWILTKKLRRGTRETMANATGKLATTAQLIAVVLAVAWPPAFAAAACCAAITGVGAGLSYWQRELGRKA